MTDNQITSPIETLRQDFEAARKAHNRPGHYLTMAMLKQLTPISWHNGHVIALVNPVLLALVRKRHEYVLDALQSVASYREELPDYVEPNFLDQEVLLDIKDARHPLLTDPVPNSITIRGKGITITGSNMAGKTTFLRTLGANAILAQTIYTCLATFYTAKPFRIISLISETDSLIEGKSYYLVQAEHLLRMIRSCEKEVLTLLSEGKSSKEIAELLYISPRTVEHHRASINRKLNIQNIVDLVKYAIREGLTSLEV